jgi:hypothetical protein
MSSEGPSTVKGDEDDAYDEEEEDENMGYDFEDADSGEEVAESTNSREESVNV